MYSVHLYTVHTFTKQLESFFTSIIHSVGWQEHNISARQHDFIDVVSFSSYIRSSNAVVHTTAQHRIQYLHVCILHKKYVSPISVAFLVGKKWQSKNDTHQNAIKKKIISTEWMAIKSYCVLMPNRFPCEFSMPNDGNTFETVEWYSMNTYIIHFFDSPCWLHRIWADVYTYIPYRLFYWFSFIRFWTTFLLPVMIRLLWLFHI